MNSAERAISRKSKILKTFSVGLYSKLVAVIVSFTMVPMAVEYLGVDGYGLWVAVSSFVAMLSFVDGGAGNALVNLVSHATGKHSHESIKTIVSSGFFVLFLIAILGGLLLYGLSSYIPWAWIFGVSNDVNLDELELLVFVMGLVFFVGMPCAVVGSVERGFQEGNIEAFWNAKGHLLSLLFSYVAIQMNLGLVGFASAFVVGPIVAAIANSIYYFFSKRNDISPSFAYVKMDAVKSVLGTGGLFFVLQIVAAIQMQGDNIIIANMLGASSVSKYAVCMQLFMAVPMMMALLWSPLWPAYREALASGDNAWIQLVFFKSLKLALGVGIPAAIILVVFGQNIIRLWVGDDLVPSMLLLVGCGAWLLFVVIGNALAMFLNGVQWIKVQVIVAISAGALNILITIFLIEKIGISGAVYGSALSYLICVILPYSILIPRYLNKMSEV